MTREREAADVLYGGGACDRSPQSPVKQTWMTAASARAGWRGNREILDLRIRDLEDRGIVKIAALRWYTQEWIVVVVDGTGEGLRAALDAWSQPSEAKKLTSQYDRMFAC